MTAAESLVAQLSQAFQGELLPNEPMARHTTFRIGGPADLYAQPADRASLLLVYRCAWELGVPALILGAGSNVLVSDRGFRGVVIATEKALKATSFEGDVAFAEAGVNLASFVRACAKRGLAGIEGMCGIPGTVGGAVVMNAGANGCEVASCLLHADLLTPDLREVRLTRDELDLRYRDSALKGLGWVVLSATFRLTPASPDELMERVHQMETRRRATQPVGERNAGCVFKNPPGASAGRLLDEAGAKGLRVGDAQISTKHANFIVNRGNASAADVKHLMERARAIVEEKYGILLEPELLMVGEWE